MSADVPRQDFDRPPTAYQSGAGPSPRDLDALQALEQKLRGALAPNLLLMRSIGAGGMARVFLAREPALKRLVAVKVLSGDLASSSQAKARFEREAQAVAGLSHPNIVSIHSVGELDDGTPYFVMQYVEGRSMHARVGDDGPLSVPEARRAIGEVAAALAAAHQQGVIHRDVKPANILYEESTGRSLVSDFGIAAMSAAVAAPDMRLTGTGMLLGTPQYMSPEQLLAEPVTEKTDIYSLGLLAHELLAGSSPFKAATPHELIAAHLRDTPPRLVVRRADVDPELDEIVARCLDKDPANRPAANEIARRLGGAALLEWPAPGLEELHGRMRQLSLSYLPGGGLIAAAMLTIFAAGPRLNPVASSPSSMLVLTAALIGVVALGAAVRRTILRGSQASRAVAGGYAWMTVLETLCDTRGDTGNVITGSREYAALRPAARDRLRRERVLRECMLLAAGVLCVPLLLLLVLLGSAGVLGPRALWVVAAIPILLFDGGLWLAFREQRAFYAFRRTTRAAQDTDLARMAAPWNEAFEFARSGQALGRGTRVAPSAGRIAAVVATVMMALGALALVPLTIVGTIGPSLWSSTIPKFANTRSKLQIAAATRPYMLPADSSISPLTAGRAFHALLRGGGDRPVAAFPENPPAFVLPPLIAGEMPPAIFPKLRNMRIGLPNAPGVVSAARAGFTPAEMAYLEGIAAAPHWRVFDLVASARSMDYFGARFPLPLPEAHGWWSMPVPKFEATKQLAFASIAKAAYHLARGQRDSAEATLRRTISFGFRLVDNGNTLIEQLIGIVIVGIGRDGLIEYYRSVDDPRGARLRASTDSVIAFLDARNADNTSTGQFDGINLQDVVALRATMIRMATDETEMRGLRLEMLGMLAIAPCTNVRELIFGPAADVKGAFERVRKRAARFASDSALIDLVYDTPERLETLAGQRDAPVVRVSRVVGKALFNPRIAGCTTLMLDAATK